MKLKINKKILLLLTLGTVSIASISTLENHEVKDVKIEAENNNNNLKEKKEVKKIDKSKEIKKEEKKEINPKDKLKYDETKVVISNTQLNIRKDSNTDSEVIGIMPEGGSLETTGKIKDDWYEVKYGNDKGFVSGKYVDENTIRKIKNKFKKVAYVTEDTILYDEENEKKELINVETYQSVLVYDEVKDYYLTEIDGNIGYVNKNVTEDLTNRFVVVDITDQKLTLYENNKIIMTSDVVTGKPATPTGIGLFSIYDRSFNRDLVGRNGARNYVDVMLKFNGNEGLHDAEYHVHENGKRHGWRNISEFGGNTYLYRGSHGCVNMPHDKAIEIAEKTDYGTKVLVKK